MDECHYPHRPGDDGRDWHGRHTVAEMGQVERAAANYTGGAVYHFADTAVYFRLALSRPLKTT